MSPSGSQPQARLCIRVAFFADESLCEAARPALCASRNTQTHTLTKGGLCVRSPEPELRLDLIPSHLIPLSKRLLDVRGACQDVQSLASKLAQAGFLREDLQGGRNPSGFSTMFLMHLLWEFSSPTQWSYTCDRGNVGVRSVTPSIRTVSTLLRGGTAEAASTHSTGSQAERPGGRSREGFLCAACRAHHAIGADFLVTPAPPAPPNEVKVMAARPEDGLKLAGQRCHVQARFLRKVSGFAWGKFGVSGSAPEDGELREKNMKACSTLKRAVRAPIASRASCRLTSAHCKRFNGTKPMPTLAHAAARNVSALCEVQQGR